MSSAIRFEIPGYIQPKQRPRDGTFHTPKKTRVFESTTAKTAKAAMGRKRPFFGHVSLFVQIVCEIPKSWSRKKANEALAGDIFPAQCDMDNQIKSISDALNGVVYGDDRQITYIEAVRSYGLRPHAVVEVREIKNIREVMG